jgi:hypothetical protein
MDKIAMSPLSDMDIDMASDMASDVDNDDNVATNMASDVDNNDGVADDMANDVSADVAGDDDMDNDMAGNMVDDVANIDYMDRHGCSRGIGSQFVNRPILEMGHLVGLFFQPIFRVTILAQNKPQSPYYSPKYKTTHVNTTMHGPSPF